MIEKINEFIIPWGSENICYWCRKDYKCKYYSEDKEVEILKYCIPIKIRPTQLMKLGQLCGCPIQEFELNRNRLPKEFKNCKIIERY